MSRKSKHVPVSLHPLRIDDLPKEEIRIILLDRIAASGNPKYLPVLEAWASGFERWTPVAGQR
jgi:hypothetical protein